MEIKVSDFLRDVRSCAIRDFNVMYSRKERDHWEEAADSLIRDPDASMKESDYATRQWHYWKREAEADVRSVSEFKDRITYDYGLRYYETLKTVSAEYDYDRMDMLLDDPFFEPLKEMPVEVEKIAYDPSKFMSDLSSCASVWEYGVSEDSTKDEDKKKCMEIMKAIESRFGSSASRRRLPSVSDEFDGQRDGMDLE